MLEWEQNNVCTLIIIAANFLRLVRSLFILCSQLRLVKLSLKNISYLGLFLDTALWAQPVCEQRPACMMDILKSCKVEGHLYSMCVWMRVKCVCIYQSICYCAWGSGCPQRMATAAALWMNEPVCVWVRLCVWESSKASGKDRAWTSSQHTSCGCYTRTTHTVLQVNQPTADHFVSLSRRRRTR